MTPSERRPSTADHGSVVRKAVIPAAGMGTRFLPATKSMPKEMLPIVDTPVLQFVIEEAVASGIDDILIVTGRGKRAIENHFDFNPELEAFLADGGKARTHRAGTRHRRPCADPLHPPKATTRPWRCDSPRTGPRGRPAVRRPARRHDHRSARGAQTGPAPAPGRLRREAGQRGGGAPRPPGVGGAVRDRGRPAGGGQPGRDPTPDSWSRNLPSIRRPATWPSPAGTSSRRRSSTASTPPAEAWAVRSSSPTQ